MRFRRVIRILARGNGLGVLATLALALATLACAPPRPNIILISVDTLRADAVFGDSEMRAETPVIDALAERGVRFAQAYSPSSWTAPSMATLVSGIHPASHGVVKGKSSTIAQKVLHTKVVTWAEALRAAGYRTHAVVTNEHLLGDLGFSQGFDTYRHLGWEGSGALVTSTLLDNREEVVAAGEPWFVWLHYYDPHLGYQFRERFLQSERMQSAALKCERYRGKVGRANWRHPLWEPCAKAAYLSEVSATDRAIGDALEGLGVNDDDLVVLASDHGEEFAEHGGIEHGRTLFEEVTRVPLLIAFPGRWRAGTVVEQPVGLADALPTVLAYLELEASPLYQGTSLLGLIDGSRDASPQILAVERTNRVIAIVDGRWKLVKTGDTNRKLQLFDLENDPGERKNVYAQEPEIAARLDGMLSEQFRELKKRRFKNLKVRNFEADEIERLKAMGYIE